MLIRRTNEDGSQELRLDRPEDITAASQVELAAALLLAAFEREPEAVVSRRALIRRFTGNLERARREPLGRRLAEAFQALERAGLVCEDVEETRDGHYFATAEGRGLLRSSALIDEISLRLGR